MRRRKTGKTYPEFDGAFDANGIMIDGARARVPLTMVDGDSWREDMHAQFRAADVAARKRRRAQEPEQEEEEEEQEQRNDGFVVDHRAGGPFVTDHRKAPLVDAAMHRPGYRFDQGAAAAQLLADAYAAYDADMASRWQTPQPSYDASAELNRGGPPGAYPLSAGEGRACTINGAPGTLVRDGDWLVCKPTRTDAAPTSGQLTRGDSRILTGDALREAQQRVADAYAEYDREQAEAWRS